MSKLNRVKNTKRNARWGIIEKILNILFQFITRTLLIKILGEEFLGLSSLFTSILQVLSMAELGFSSAVIFNLYKPIAENDKKTICALMNSYKRIYRLIGIIVLVVGLLLLPLLPHFINGKIPKGYNLYWLYIIYLFNTVISYFLFAYKNCLLEAHQRNDLVSKTRIALIFFQSIYQFIVIYYFKNYYLYIIVMPLVTIMSNVINALIANRLYPDYKCNGELDIETKSKIKLNVAGLSIGKICLVSRNSLDNIFLSTFINLTAVAIYNNYYYIFSALNIFLSVITNAMGAGVGNSIATESVKKNYKDFCKFNFMYLWISGWCTITLFCLYQPFMEMWMGKNLLFPMSTVSLLCVYFFSLKLGDIRSIYSNSAGLFWESRIYVIIEVFMNAILNYFLGKYFGVNGIILATNLTIIFINFIFGTKILFDNYFKDESIIKYMIKNIYYILVTSLICIVMYFIISHIHFSLLNSFFLIGIICCLLPNIIYYLCYFNLEEYKNSVYFIKNIIKTQSKSSK